ncbi:Hsp20/alpha crystallin family protein [Thalassotalea mangrovi]|uniref:Hsp20/alpha crystallin family protein n=1 Tax=Thalassotalea mangrovi TaxID=2572245 RepID=A0A4U1BBR4_9GAMM|nr:Hsp20/alpha crystallin family protein [Thalassotalea mangrovi]TKB47871.1 Hsp20/alpha crystallin family protein [Thalassotalea mangrovi]
MSLLPRDWFHNDHPFNDFFHLSKDFQQSFFQPKIDVTEKKDHIEVLAELPGVKKEDIDLSLQNGVITLSAKIEESTSSEEDKVIRKERRTGSIERSFSVGKGVSEKDISASFKDGLLKLCFPKTTAADEDTKKISLD